MNTKKDPAALERGPGIQTTFTNFDYSVCGHERATLVKLECGAGGTQFRRFCLRCWVPIGSAIPHLVAHAEVARTGIEAPIADLEIIHAAQSCFARRERNGGRP